MYCYTDEHCCIIGNISKSIKNMFFRIEIWHPDLSKNIGPKKLAKTHLFQRLQTRRASRTDLLYGRSNFLGMGVSKNPTQNLVIGQAGSSCSRLWKISEKSIFSGSRFGTQTYQKISVQKNQLKHTYINVYKRGEHPEPTSYTVAQKFQAEEFPKIRLKTQ